MDTSSQITLVVSALTSSSLSLSPTPRSAPRLLTAIIPCPSHSLGSLKKTQKWLIGRGGCVPSSFLLHSFSSSCDPIPFSPVASSCFSAAIQVNFLCSISLSFCLMLCKFCGVDYYSLSLPKLNFDVLWMGFGQICSISPDFFLGHFGFPKSS